MAEVIVVHGYPGSGKTTQCERVAKEGFLGKSIQHISIGDRLNAIRGGRISSDHSDYLNSPEATSPPPDEIAKGVIFEAINEDTKDLILIDGYPRYAHAVDGFYAGLQENNHRLIGTVDFDVSIFTSEHRILERGPREDESSQPDILESFASFRFNRHRQTAHIAMLALSNLAPIEVIDANGSKDDVYGLFSAALGRLVLRASSRES